MKTTDVLIREHGLILSSLENLSLARDKIEKGELPPREFFEKAVWFSSNFFDQFHHFKEEFLMFGLLAEKKNGAIDHDIGALRHQHERCRKYIRKIKYSIDGYSRGNEIPVTTLLENLASYISLLRRHIYREEHIFFKMADKVIDGDEGEELLTRFKSEEDKFGDQNFFDKCQGVVFNMKTVINR